MKFLGIQPIYIIINSDHTKDSSVVNGVVNGAVEGVVILKLNLKKPPSKP